MPAAPVTASVSPSVARLAAPGGGARVPCSDGVLLMVCAFVLYTAFAQVTIYQGDGFQFVVWVTSGQFFHNIHYFYLPLLHFAKSALGAIGVEFYAAATALSAAGAALGTSFVHAGCRRLGFGRAHCLQVAALVGLAPGVFFFATVVEVHAAFFALAGIAFYAATRLLEPGGSSVLRGIGFGLATGLSFTIHASGVALPFGYGLWVIAESHARGRDMTITIARLGVAAVTHAILVGAALYLVPLLANVQGDNAVSFWSLYAWQPLGEVLVPTLRFEWLWAFLPTSLWFALGLARREQRWQAIALLVTLVPYLIVALKLVPAVNERGAYLLPLCVPAALISIACTPRWLGWILVVIAGSTGVWMIAEHDDREPARALAQGIRAAVDDQAIELFVADQHGMEACMSYLPGTTMHWLGNLLMTPPELWPALEGALDRRLDEAAAAGKRLVVTEAVEIQLARAERELGLTLAGNLRAWFVARTAGDGEPIAVGAFRGRLLAR